VWTNGAIAPATAVAKAAELLMAHLPIFEQLQETSAPAPAQESDSVLDRDVDELELGARISNMLRNAGIATLRDLVAKGEDDLRALPGFGHKALTEVCERLEAMGLGLGMRFDLPRA